MEHHDVELDSYTSEGEEKPHKEEDSGWQDLTLADLMNESDYAVLIDFAPSQIPGIILCSVLVQYLFVMVTLTFLQQSLHH